MTAGRLLLVAAVATALGAAAPSAADAAFPGANGRIAFTTAGQVSTIDASGGGAIATLGAGGWPAWSPDGQRIAYSDSATGITVMKADGTGKTPITASGSDREPAWSPDGKKIVFARFAGGFFDLYVASSDGSGSATPLTSTASANESAPSWSPDGGRIAYVSGGEIYVMPSGGGQGTRVTPDASPDLAPDWSPDGSKLVFECQAEGVGVCTIAPGGGGRQRLFTTCANPDPVFSPDEKKLAFQQAQCASDGHSTAPGAKIQVYTTPVAGGGQTQVTHSTTAHSLFPSWQPKPTPIIFIHGFLGSKIDCGAEAWPNIPPGPDLLAMRLGPDGVSSSCAVAAKDEQGIVKRVLGSDIYDSTVKFLKRIAPSRYHVYSWDWRKSPEKALADLDQLIDKVRAGPNGKVVLMAHSMGGLVARWYIDDPQRAKKVDRAVTIGTPYWGSAKALFPLAAGVETPNFSALDTLFFPNDEVRQFAQNLQGLYFLWPSAAYGPWLTDLSQGQAPLDTQGVRSFVGRIGGNQALLARAAAGHAAHLDSLQTNGVDFHVVVGTGVLTIERVRVLPLLGGRAFYEIDWQNGDGTVPRGSARIGGSVAPNRLHYACGVEHVQLPGDPTVTNGIDDFLLDGKPITGLANDCAASGFQFQTFSLSLGPQAAAAGKGLTLDQAQRQGLIERLDLGAQQIWATNGAQPVTVKLRSQQVGLVVTPLHDGTRGKPLYFGPLSGKVLVKSGAEAVIKANGKQVKPRKHRDRKPPRTRVKVKIDGSRAILRFKAKDTSGVAATYVKVGKSKGRRVQGKLKIKKSKLEKVRFQSVDVFGNVEKLRRVP